ncbi:outer membrane protein assembly factor BamB family protein [Micromonospora parathelypteridis]|uniref:Outer membrane protein assembly factor BamB n=1 Tax=Micromonospora parathelypteridis TaxID=1839617 RepID=A0A840W179_9ACTN|nr:PQQ-binding-like beta-propeller repeat protein [Micromonospora parathelypteridis]MBB5479834.1 outer membrane protein assembly factor BamB [Micromonospora parathelypteridis]GGO26299.1 hypothetical protein GCM10011576_49800 [Micromonospora parathelypteridis]
MSIIELGEIRDEPTAVPPVRRPRAAGRPLRSSAVLLLALVVLAGATPPPERTVIVVPAARAATVYLAADSVFVVDPPTPNEDRHLTAYAQPSPSDAGMRRRWQASLPRHGDYLNVLVQQGLVLVMGVDAAGVFQTTAFDAETGQQRWQHPGAPQPIVDGGLLLSDSRGDGSGAISRVEAETGRLLWSVPVPSPGESTYHGAYGRVDQFLLVQPTGEVQVYDATSGQLLRSVDTLPGDRSAFQRVQVVDDLLLLVPPGATRLVGYGLPGLNPLWTTEVPLVSYTIRCGDLLCVVPQNGGLQVLDPATGLLRWSDPTDLLADVRGDRLLVAGTGAGYAVRDAATGQPRIELGNWALIPVLGRDDPLLGVRQTADGRVVVAKLDLVAGRAQVIDVLPGLASNCQASLPVLLCQRLDGSPALWRLRP